MVNYLLLQDYAEENLKLASYDMTDIVSKIKALKEGYDHLNNFSFKERQDLAESVGNLMVRCLELGAMLRWDPDKTFNPTETRNIIECYQKMGHEIQRFSDLYSEQSDNPQLRDSLGNLMGYCNGMMEGLEVSEYQTLTSILVSNENQLREQNPY